MHYLGELALLRRHHDVNDGRVGDRVLQNRVDGNVRALSRVADVADDAQSEEPGRAA